MPFRIRYSFFFVIVTLLLSGCGSSVRTTKDDSPPPSDGQLTSVDELEEKVKTWRIGLLLPLTGKQANLGKQVLDAVILSLADSNIDNVSIITFDVNETPQKAIQAAYNTISMKVDLVIGPILADTARITTPILSQSNIRSFVLSNDTSLAGPLVHVLGISYDAAIASVLDFAYRQGKQNLALLLPSSPFGQQINARISPIATNVGMNTRLTRYYQPSNSTLYARIVRNIANNFYFSVRMDQQGNKYQKNIRDKKPVDPQEGQSEADSIILQDMLDTLLVEARGKDLYLLTSEINKNSLTSKLTVLSSDGIIDELTLKNHHAKGIIFATAAENGLSQFKDNFRDHFQYTPHRVAVLAYDIFAIISYLIKNDGHLDNIYDPQGFKGVYGESLFKDDGVVLRKFNICRVGNKQLELLERLDVFT